MCPNLLEALEVSMEEIKKPPMIPVGTYRVKVNKIPQIVSDNDDWEFVDFPVLFLEATDDVDPDELAEFGGLNKVYRTKRFLFDRNDEKAFGQTMYNVRRFLRDHLKIDGADNMKLNQALDTAVGHEFLLAVGRRPDKNDKEIQYEDFKKTAPVD